MAIKIVGNSSGNIAEVNSANQLKIVPETNASSNPGNIGGVRIFSENDQGTVTGVTRLRSQETDVDYRARASLDTILDEEIFNYAAQNTGKHYYLTTTLTSSFTASGAITNNGSSTAAGSTSINSYAYFPNIGTNTLSLDTEVGFSASPQTNVIVEFGLGIAGSAASVPTDGVFFRLTSAGLQGIATSNGTETSTGVFPTSSTNSSPFTYTLNKRYQFIVYVGGIEAQFWINDGTGPVLYGSIPMPAGQNRICSACGVQYFHKHRQPGVAGGVLQSIIGSYNIRLGGANINDRLSIIGNRVMGSYQGMSGGTMGGLSKYTNSTNATAAVPTNTTAALGTGLGGEFWETDTLAVNTDGIILSYQIPAASVSVPGKRLVLRGVKIDTYVQTALTGGGYNEVWTLNFGHTSVSLATAEAVSTKKPRVVMIGARTVAAGAAALTQLPTLTLDLGDAPVYVNPNEFIAIAKKKVGTAPTAGVMAHNITMVYGWE